MASLPSIGLHEIYGAQVTEMSRCSAVGCPREQKFDGALVEIAERKTYFLDEKTLDHIFMQEFPRLHSASDQMDQLLQAYLTLACGL